MTKVHKISKHGTLADDDVQGALPIRISQVVMNCFDSNIEDYFGNYGDLPPDTAIETELKWTTFHKLIDEKTGQTWIGLNKITNEEKGLHIIQLPAGEYKVELTLPRDLNANIATDVAGIIYGTFATLNAQDQKEAEEKYKRGLPTVQLDARLQASGKKYGIIDESCKMDLGLYTKMVRTFQVQEHEAPATLSISLYSHSLLKRLKVVGTIYRREIVLKPDVDVKQQIQLGKKGKNLLQKAMGSCEFKSEILRPDVDLVYMLKQFYAIYAPDRVEHAEAILNHFQGRIDDMILSIEVKYDVKFDEFGVARKLPNTPRKAAQLTQARFNSS